MALMTFFMGLFFVGYFWLFNTWRTKKKYSITWLGWLGITLTLIMALFTIAWSLSSVLEDTMQAAGMGLLIFGGIAIIFGALTRIVIVKGIPKSKNVSVNMSDTVN